MYKRNLKIVISLTCVAFIILRIIFPNLNIDEITLGLLIVATIPWMSPLFKSVGVPGVVNVDFAEEINEVATKIERAAPNILNIKKSNTDETFTPNLQDNPTLFLAWIRIEIERRLRILADIVEDGDKSKESVRRLMLLLSHKGVFDNSTTDSLLNLMKILNAAVHGEVINEEDVPAAVEEASILLEILDAKIAVERESRIGADKV